MGLIWYEYTLKQLLILYLLLYKCNISEKFYHRIVILKFK